MTLPIISTINRIAAIATAQQLVIATAESCTAGKVAHLLTQVAGASQWFYGGIVAYHNDIKTSALSVSPALIARHGAVSEETARAMCEGAKAMHPAITTTIAVTGIAGPGGGSLNKPIGTVCFAHSSGQLTQASTHHFSGDRDAVRIAAAQSAITQLHAHLTTLYGSP